MKNQEPPCSVCLPELFPENVNAAKIWNLVQDQRIWLSSGLEKPVSAGLMHMPIWRLIDEFGIEGTERFETFLKVLNVYEHIRSIED